MNPLILEGTEYTPEINFDKEKGIFNISGRSLHEDTLDFFTPIYNWLQEYIRDPNENTIVNLKIEYFNSASHKAVHEIIEMFRELVEIGKQTTINWHYLEGDDDMLESGQDFQELSGLEFNFETYTKE